MTDGALFCRTAVDAVGDLKESPCIDALVEVRFMKSRRVLDCAKDEAVATYDRIYRTFSTSVWWGQ